VTAPICKGCGRPLPVLREPIPVDLDLAWSNMMWIEKRALVAMMLDHVKGTRGRGEFAEWDMLAIGTAGLLMYRQVSNAMRRLVPCRWVERVRKGRYRLTPHAVEQLRPMITPGTRVTQYRARDRHRRHP
jgi:hypothetical protein